MLAKPCRLAVGASGMAEQTAPLFETAQQFEKVERFRQSFGPVRTRLV
ncbi:hypothetical protein X742_25360 [Mesorhizobium sp. LNHC232B00]|nr:hypothetical protein X742_25360 [Mesorhizobium sp. LNHC232B00]